MIQTLWHSDGTPENFFGKDDFEINQQTTKFMQTYPEGKMHGNP